MGLVVGVSISIDKADLKKIDELRKHPNCVFRERSTFIRWLVKKSLPIAEKEIIEGY